MDKTDWREISHGITCDVCRKAGFRDEWLLIRGVPVVQGRCECGEEVMNADHIYISENINRVMGYPLRNKPSNEPPTDAGVYEFRGEIWRGEWSGLVLVNRNTLEGQFNLAYKIIDGANGPVFEPESLTSFDGQWSPKLESFFDGGGDDYSD